MLDGQIEIFQNIETGTFGKCEINQNREIVVLDEKSWQVSDWFKIFQYPFRIPVYTYCRKYLSTWFREVNSWFWVEYASFNLLTLSWRDYPPFNTRLSKSWHCFRKKSKVAKLLLYFYDYFYFSIHWVTYSHYLVIIVNFIIVFFLTRCIICIWL